MGMLCWILGCVVRLDKIRYDNIKEGNTYSRNIIEKMVKTCLRCLDMRRIYVSFVCKENGSYGEKRQTTIK